MSIYSEVEQDYAFLCRVAPKTRDVDVRNQLFELMLKRRTEITAEEEANIRVYLDTMGTLEGLTQWVYRQNSSSE